MDKKNPQKRHEVSETRYIVILVETSEESILSLLAFSKKFATSLSLKFHQTEQRVHLAQIFKTIPTSYYWILKDEYAVI